MTLRGDSSCYITSVGRRRYGADEGRQIGCIIGMLLGSLASSNALAQTEHSETVPTNSVTNEGIRAFTAGQYEEANAKLEQALELKGVSTLALYAARTNVKLVRWVRATEWYVLAMRQRAPSGPESSAGRPSPWTVTTLSDPREREPGDFQKTAGWFGVGLGTAGYLVGIVAGVSLLSTRSQLNDECVNNRCDASAASKVDHYNSLRTWSTNRVRRGNRVCWNWAYVAINDLGTS